MNVGVSEAYVRISLPAEIPLDFIPLHPRKKLHLK